MTNEINKLSGNERKFAIACIEMNSVEELTELHTPDDADEIDCKEWDISPQEWSNAVEAARLDMIDEDQE